MKCYNKGEKIANLKIKTPLLLSYYERREIAQVKQQCKVCKITLLKTMYAFVTVELHSYKFIKYSYYVLTTLLQVFYSKTILKTLNR